MRSQIKILEEEVLRFKVSVFIAFKVSKRWKAELFPFQRLQADAERRYQREQTLMLGHIYALGRQLQRSAGTVQASMHNGPTSWLGQQRKGVGKVSLDLFRVKLTVHRAHPAQPNCSTMIMVPFTAIFFIVNGFVCKTLHVHRRDTVERMKIRNTFVGCTINWLIDDKRRTSGGREM